MCEWICFFRLVGAFGIVLLHVSNDVMQRSVLDSAGWWTALVVRATVQWAAPAFIMVSGALLLARDKRESIRTFYVKRERRILLPLLFWSLFYLVWNAHSQNLGFSQTLTLLVHGRPHYHLWFLYVLGGLYLLTPFLRRRFVPLALGSKVAWVALVFALSVLYTAVNHAWLQWQYNGFTYCLPYLSYYCAGHVLTESRLARKAPGAGLLIVALLCMVLTVVTFHGLTIASNDVRRAYWALSYFAPWIIILTLAMFLLFRRTQCVNSCFVRNHRTSFGIYLIHLLILSLVSPYPYLLGPVTGIPILAVTVFFLSCVLSEMMLAVPGLRRLV